MLVLSQTGLESKSKGPGLEQGISEGYDMVTLYMQDFVL